MYFFPFVRPAAANRQTRASVQKLAKYPNFHEFLDRTGGTVADDLAWF
jgi:hypothetical protein